MKNPREVFLDALEKEDVSIYDSIPNEYTDRSSIESLVRSYESIGFHALPVTRKMRKKYGMQEIRKQCKDLAVVSGIGGPFTRATEEIRVIDSKQQLALSESKFALVFENPARLKELIEEETRKIIIDAGEQAEYADAFLMTDPTSSLVNARCFEQFSRPYIRKVCDAIGKPVMVHIPGNVFHIYKLFEAAGIAGAQPFDRLNTKNPDIGEILGNIGNVSVIGNVSCTLFESGTPAEVYAESADCLKKGVNILHSDFWISGRQNVPLDNIRAFVKAYRDYKNLK